MNDVAVVGAGPYGLSLAARLRDRGAPLRIFGKPMQAWRDYMPQGMFLKSEGFASNLVDPGRALTLRRFCALHGLPYGDYGVPVPLDTFVRYGQWFRSEAVGEVEDTIVRSLKRANGRFALVLENGEHVSADRVVVATGVRAHAHVPSVLRDLPPELCTHSSDHHDLGGFRATRVTVVGGGQSALETATLLREAGAEVRVIVRRDEIAWNPPPMVERPLKQRLRYPRAGLGDGWDFVAYSRVPLGFHALPEARRLALARTVLGPAGAWWLKSRFDNEIDLLLASSVIEARASSDGVRLRVSRRNGDEGWLETDHVVAATGYRPAVASLQFLDGDLRGRVRAGAAGPILSRSFESSVPGLYFVGLPAAASFGPAQRFVLGADFAARRIAKHVLRARPRRSRVRV